MSPSLRPSSMVLLSGGLDSLVSLHWAHQQTDLMLGITIDYGQRAAEREIEASAAICRHYDIKHQIIRLPWYKEMKSSALVDRSISLPALKVADLDNQSVVEKSAQVVWVPNRNGVFINVAASIAESWVANLVVVGFNKEEAATFPDNSESFVIAANDALKFSTKGRVTVKAPMGSKTKKEIVRWALEHEVDLNLLWSCYRGDESMCGACESCLRLKRALKDGGAGKILENLF